MKPKVFKRQHITAILTAAVFSGAALSLPTVATAGSAEAGALVSFEQASDQLVLVYSNGERSHVPACAKTSPKWWAIDASTIAGQEQLRELAKLQIAGKKIRIVGTGECHDSKDAETISFFYPVSDTPTVPIE
jgi:hypothetical protein